MVLETLTPAERLAFVLHDTFGVPFEEIALIVGRTPTTTRQLASRARRRVRGAAGTTSTAVDHRRQREIVDAFLVASRAGDFDALLRVLNPDVVIRSDGGPRHRGLSGEVRGAPAALAEAARFRVLAHGAKPALVNGSAGLVVFADDRPFAVLGFAFDGGRMVAIDILADPDRLVRLDLDRFR